MYILRQCLARYSLTMRKRAQACLARWNTLNLEVRHRVECRVFVSSHFYYKSYYCDTRARYEMRFVKRRSTRELNKFNTFTRATAGIGDLNSPCRVRHRWWPPARTRLKCNSWLLMFVKLQLPALWLWLVVQERRNVEFHHLNLNARFLNPKLIPGSYMQVKFSAKKYASLIILHLCGTEIGKSRSADNADLVLRYCSNKMTARISH